LQVNRGDERAAVIQAVDERVVTISSSACGTLFQTRLPKVSAIINRKAPLAQVVANGEQAGLNFIMFVLFTHGFSRVTQTIDSQRRRRVSETFLCNSPVDHEAATGATAAGSISPR